MEQGEAGPGDCQPPKCHPLEEEHLLGEGALVRGGSQRHRSELMVFLVLVTPCRATTYNCHVGIFCAAHSTHQGSMKCALPAVSRALL